MSQPSRVATASSLRLFVGLPVPTDTIARIERLQGRLATSARAIRWTDPGQLHLTLVFLGDAVPSERVPAIAAALDSACEGRPPLEFAFGGVGQFPAAGSPRVVWLGVTAGGEELVALQDAIAAALEPLGFPREARGWQPHVTLGRAASRGRLPPAEAAHLAETIGRLHNVEAGGGLIDEVVLFASVRTDGRPAHHRLHARRLLACGEQGDSHQK